MRMVKRQPGWALREDYGEHKFNAIGWTDDTINFTRGCSHVDGRLECARCYAAYLTFIQQRNPTLKDSIFRQPLVTVKKGGVKLYVCEKTTPADVRWFTGLVVPHSETQWLKPFDRVTPALYFVGDMSDLFHESIPEAIVLHWLRTLHKSWHTFQVLTKRHDRMKAIMERLYLRLDGCLDLHPEGVVEPWDSRPMLPNVWFGVTVGMASVKAEAIAALKAVKATVRYLSMEPLFEHIDIGSDLADGQLHWVIVGGESGAHMELPSCAKRAMKPEWAYSLRDQCWAAKVPLYFKQLSGMDPEKLPADEYGIHWPWLPLRPQLVPPEHDAIERLRDWAAARYEKIVKPWGDHVRSKGLINLQTGLLEAAAQPNTLTSPYLSAT